MTENSRPWNGTIIGDAGPYSDADWQELYRAIIGWGGNRANNGVFLSSGTQPNNGLRVIEQSPAGAGVTVNPGAALVQGIAYINDDDEDLAVGANGSSDARIDTVVLQADYALQTVRLVVKQGTPAASPSQPTLTQVANVMWEIPIADIAVASSFTSIIQANISPRQNWVNAPPGLYLDSVLNNSGVTLEDGDVVIWDSTADRAVTTSTTLGDDRIAGVWRSRTLNGASGQLQTAGIGYVNASAAVTRGDALQISTTTERVVSTLNLATVLGRALETTAGAGLVLANIDIQTIAEAYVLIQDQKAQNTAGGTFTTGAWQKRDLNVKVVDTHNLVSLASSVITLQPGTYRCRWDCPAFSTVLSHQSKLVNTSDTIEYMGTSQRNATGNSVCDRSVGVARFRITSAKNFELQHRCTQTVVTAGFGQAANLGTEVYSTIEFWREGS